MKDQNTTDSAILNSGKQQKPSFLRLTILLSPTKSNSAALNDIATYAETKLKTESGYRLIKASVETIHAIETYGQRDPDCPKPERVNDKVRLSAKD